MVGFVAQLALLARGWGRRVVRSKRGFGLPGDFSEMSLSFCERNVCRIVHVSLVNVACGEVLGGSLCSLLFQTCVYCLVCIVRMQIEGCCS